MGNVRQLERNLVLSSSTEPLQFLEPLDDVGLRFLVGQSPVRSRVAQAGPDDPAPKTMAAFTLKRSTMGASSCSYDRCQSVAVTQVDPAADPKTVSTFRASASTKKGV